MRIAVRSGSEAVKRALEQVVENAGHRIAKGADAPELVLIDGFHKSKETTPEGPSLTLSATAAEGDERLIPCPIHPSLLATRLAMRSQVQALALGNGWALDTQARVLSHAEGGRLPLTEKECQLLRSIVGAAGKALAREALLESVWGMGEDIDTHTIETHIYRLRSKLEVLSPYPGDLVTEGGTYRFKAG